MPDRHLKPPRASPAEAAQFYRQLADLSPQMLWSARPDGSAEFFNARACQYSGRTLQQLEGWGWQSIVHPDDWERCLPRWTKAFKRGQLYEVEYRLRRHDGRYLWHLGTAVPQREGGRIVRWFGSSTEIESQKRAEKLLEKSRAALQALVRAHAEHGSAGGADAWRRSHETEVRLRSVIALSSDFFWETDAGHRITLLEAGGQADSFEFSPGRIGKTRWEIPSVLPDAEGWRRHRQTLDARQSFRDFEIARLDDAGVVRHFVIHGGPFFDPKRRFLGYRGVGREITARRLAERALEEYNRQFRAFLESMPGIAWIKDSKLRYVWTSASYERILGKSLDELRGRDDFAVWPREMAEGFRLNDEKVLRVNGAVQDVASTPLADGSVARWMAVKFPLLDETGAPGVAGIGFEVTARDGEAGADGLDDSPLARLSGRELQVLHLLVEGCTSAEMGARLALSPKSVDTYRSRLMAKLNIEDLPTLVKFALRHGLTTKR